MTGRAVTSEELNGISHRDGDPLQIGERLFIILDEPWIFANHGCDPNVGITQSLDVIALRNIEAGEELLYDYSTTMQESEGTWTLTCECKSLLCRRVIGDFSTLDISTQTKYIALGVVQPFILDHIEQ